MNLYLIDKKSKSAFDLYQTPTDVTKRCLAAGNTAGILASYIEHIRVSESDELELSTEENAKVQGRAWELVALTNVEFNEALAVATREIQNERWNPLDDHITRLQEFLVEYPNATFTMI